jgi:hypothetical protein
MVLEAVALLGPIIIMLVMGLNLAVVEEEVADIMLPKLVGVDIPSVGQQVEAVEAMLVDMAVLVEVGKDTTVLMLMVMILVQQVQALLPVLLELVVDMAVAMVVGVEVAIQAIVVRVLMEAKVVTPAVEVEQQEVVLPLLMQEMGAVEKLEYGVGE